MIVPFLLVVGSAEGSLAVRKSQNARRICELRPTVIESSHNLRGFEAGRAVDGNPKTYWLVPGGQRMEAMSRDKYLIFDLGCTMKISEIDILGRVHSLRGSRILLQIGPSAKGPWQQAHSFRALSSLQRTRSALPKDLPSTQFVRLFIRREGHATFRYKVHDVRFLCTSET